MPFFPRSHEDPDPEPNSDTPPDTSDPTGICPRCGRHSNFKGVASPIHLYFTGMQGESPVGRVELDAAQRVSGFICLGCRQATAVIEEKWIGQHPWREGIGHGGTIRWRGSAVPKRIRSCFEEGLKCVSAGAPRGAAVMFGRALEAIVRDRGSQDAVTAMEKKNLAAGLQVMADEHIITNELGEGAKEIRLARNAGGHFDPIDDVDIAEAEGSSPLQSLS